MRLEHWRYALPLRLRSLFRRSHVERDLDDELLFHIDRQIEANLAAGMSPREARLAALRAFGHVEQHKDECREFWGVRVVDDLVRDVRHACRALRRETAFTAGVVAMLALGIGANAAVFSIVDAILLRPLPYSEPERLFVVREQVPERDSETRPVNLLHFLEWQRGCKCFESLALAEYYQEATLTGEGDPERVPAVRVTTNAFDVLGVSARLGRTFTADDVEQGAKPVVVISDGLWRRRFGADPGILGRTIMLDGIELEVVGVLPPGFRHDWGASRAQAEIDVYAPWRLTPVPPWQGWSNNFSYAAVGRLVEGVTPAAALSELNAIQAAIAEERMEGGLGLRAELVPVHDWITGESREGLLLLLAAVVAALLVACLNIANLMLVRAIGRTREAGVRCAIGASRIAIFRGVLIEGAVLASAGALLGVGVAVVGLKLFASIAPLGLPRVHEVRLEGTTLLVTLGFAVGATLVFGLLPALRLTRVDPQDALRGGRARGFTDSERRLRLRGVLVSVEVALTVSLLIVAGLLIASFVRLDAVARGYDARNVLTASISLPFTRYPDSDSRMRFYRSLVGELESSPGVIAAGLTSMLPLLGDSWGASATPVGDGRPPDERPGVQYRFVSPGYFAAMGLPLLSGRSIRDGDESRPVAILSEGAAQLLWPDTDALGRRFLRADDPTDAFEVVGIAPDVRTNGLAEDPAPLVYVPLTAADGGALPFASVAVRTAGEPSAAARLLRAAVASIDPDMAISNVRTMREIESGALGERRFQLLLVGTFGAASLLIAALGTYSVLTYAVASRAHELAIRLTLGAQPARVRRMVLRQGMRPVLLGTVIGVIGALAFGRLLRSLLFGVTPTDPGMFAAVVGVTLTAALVAAWLAARRAARAPMLGALRCE